jgi:hypothetical protein
VKRCEITLPLYYNDGRPVEEEKFETTRQELLAKYKGFSFNPDWFGIWRHEGVEYKDRNAVFQINHEDINAESLAAYKEVLKERFQQQEIQITIQDISII